MIVSHGDHSPEAWVRAVSRAIWRFLLIAGIVVISLYVLQRLMTILMWIFVAAVLAYIMRPMATWVMRKHILVPRRWPMHSQRALATLYVLILVFVGGYYSLKWTLTPFVNQVAEVTKNWETEYKPRFDQYGEDLKVWYESHVKKEWRDRIEQSFQKGEGFGDFQKTATAWVASSAQRAGSLAHNIVEIVLLPVLAFYFALDSRKLTHEFVGTLPIRCRREVARTIFEFNRIMHSFVVGQAILCALAGVFIGLLLAALGVPYALTLGLLAGFTRAIPIIGPILGGIPIVGLVLVTKGLGLALVVLTVFTILHFVESKFIMPMLIGERMELHPVVIIIVLLIGQEFGGLMGMFFAAPIAALLRVVVRRYYLKNHRRRYVQIPTSHTALPAAID